MWNIWVFPSSKLWLNNAVKDALHGKHTAFKRGGNGDKTEAKKRGKIRRTRLQYKIEIEKFHIIDLKAVWYSTEATTSQDNKKQEDHWGLFWFTFRAVSALNDFYSGLVMNDLTDGRSDLSNMLSCCSATSEPTISVHSPTSMFHNVTFMEHGWARYDDEQSWAWYDPW